MKVERLVVGQLSTNCYLISSSGKALILDPGDDGDYIARRIQDLGLAPQAILATHGHFDHILAATELKLAFKIPFYLHKADLPILVRTQSTAKFFTGLTVDPAPKVDKFLKEGQVVKIGKESLEVVATPGHTQGSVSFYAKDMVFVGDLIFAGGGRGRTDLAGGSKGLLDKSVKKILKLAKETIILPGHGEETIVEKELKCF